MTRHKIRQLCLQYKLLFCLTYNKLYNKLIIFSHEWVPLSWLTGIFLLVSPFGVAKLSQKWNRIRFYYLKMTVFCSIISFNPCPASEYEFGIWLSFEFEGTSTFTFSFLSWVFHDFWNKVIKLSLNFRLVRKRQWITSLIDL